MKKKRNHLLFLLLFVCIIYKFPAYAQDIPPFIGEGPLTIIEELQTENNLAYCANESFQVPLPGSGCVEGAFSVDNPELVVFEIGEDVIKITPLADVTVQYTIPSGRCTDGSTIEAATYIYRLFQNPICTSSPTESTDYLFVHTFCEGEVPFFFPDPPVLSAPCVSGGCDIFYVDVVGKWEPVAGGEPFPSLQSAEYIIRYPSPPCPVSECGFTGGTLDSEAYATAMAEYEESLAGYDGRLGLIEINDCQGQPEGEPDVVINICRGDSVLLEGWRNVIECPCGPEADCFPFSQPDGIWTANGERICASCINQVVYPQETTLYVQRTPPYPCPATPPVGSGPVSPPQYPAGPIISVMVVVEENCEEINNERADLEEIVEAFPWVKEIAQLENCQTESITVYTDGAFKYLLIQEGLTSVLYLEDGTFYCAQTPAFNCLDFYNLNTVTATWTCGSVGNSFGQNPPPACGEHTGTIFFDRCDDGRQFFFVRTTDGQVLDIYFDTGIAFDYYDGQPVQFDFKPADFPSPCSLADMAVIVTCMEEINASCSLLDVIDLVDNLCEQCISEIALYSFEGQTYLVSLADNTNCADGLTTVTNCSTGDLFCMDGGFAGFAQCGDFFDSALKLESILKEDCNNCICPEIFAPVCGADGKTYSNECEAACVGIEVLAEGDCQQTGTGCEITISNTQCRRIGIYDTNNNLLTTLGPGPFGNAPPGLPIPMWTDPTPLADNEQRVYVFKEGLFELGRTVATCATPEIDTRNNYSQGCNDGLSIGEYTNTGCRNVDIHTTDGEVIGSLAPEETVLLTATNNIYIFIADSDTVAVKSDIGGAINSGGCDEGCLCIALFDPVCGVDGRTYGNECEAECAGVEVAYRGACADAVVPPCHDVAGVDFGLCEAIMGIAVVAGECTFVSGCGNYVVEGVDYTEAFFPSVEVCAQICAITPPGNPIFEDYPWLTELVDPANCDNERISVYQIGNFFFIEIITTTSSTLYFQDGSFYCESMPSFNCIDAYGLTDVTASWACQNEDCICTLQYDPVCGVDGKTYGNACAAACEGVAIAAQGECSPGCLCPTVIIPVCGADGRTYNNACEAACAGVEIISEGACNEGCGCAGVFDPVCGVDGKTYSNSCEAECAGVEVATQGECSSNTDCDLLARILLPSDLCGTCIEEIAVYEYQGKTYLVTLASDNDGQGGACNDGLTTVQSCGNGNIFCSDGGIAGLTECEDFFKEATKVQVVVARENCGGCICPTVVLPVCGVDGVTYNNECEAACAGVEVVSDGICGMAKAEPCTDLAGVDFGDCRAVMGVGIVNGQCRTISGCLDLVVNGVDYSEAFFPTVDICAQTCPTPPGDPIFAEYQWLSELVNANNCTNDKVTVYQSGIYTFLYVENAAGKGLYFQDGTFYCQDSETLNCRASYGFTDIINTWTCPNGGGSNCDNPLEQNWLSDRLGNECTGDIYTIDYNGTSAIYVSTLCECLDDADMIFTCDGEFLCSVGRIAPDSRCMPDPANQLTEANLIWSPRCDCDCPAFKDPVCGVDGNTYPSACSAECAGVEIRSNGACGLTTTLTPPCYDVAGVDFGPCDAVLGAAVVNGTCQTLSGCGLIITGFDFTNSFFPTVEICQQSCEGSGSSEEIFEDYPWLNTLIDPTNCEDEKVTVYQVGIFNFLYLERGTSGTLYFQDGTYYCQDGTNIDCRETYSFTEVVATWSCGSVGPTTALDPIFEEYPWLLEEIDPNACQTAAITEYDLGGYSFIYIFDNANLGTLYLDNGTFYCQDSPGYDCLSAYNLGPDLIAKTWKCVDGLVYDSEAVAIERSKERATYFTEAVTVYPNPTKGQFQIQINSTTTEAQLVTVVDLYGRILQENKIQSNSPTVTIPVDLANEPDGLYMVVLKASGQAAIRKAVVKSGL